MLKRLLILLAAGVVLLAALVGWANLPYSHLPAGTRADRILVHKSARRLELFSHGRVLATYRVALGRHPRGPKREEGDARTPEGLYFIDYHNANSSFHRALHVSYPSPADWKRAAAEGVAPGGAIMIHGVPERLSPLGRLSGFVDWTNGCIAVTNAEIDDIFAAVPDGTPIEIQP